MAKSIAFIHIGSFSHANQHLAQVFAQQFDKHQLDIIDVRPCILSQKQLVIRNFWFMFQEYGRDLLLQRRRLRRTFFATTYMFQQLSRLAANHVSKQKHIFSFQTQSLFDGSTEDVNHFVYTDHTMLAHRHYPGLSRQELAAAMFTPAWIQLERNIYHHAALNFSMSKFVAKSMIEDYGCPADRVVQAYAGGNGVNLTETPVKAYDKKNILFVGMDWERKGGPDLVKAFEKVLKRHPDATLTIVGCSPKINVPNCQVTGRIPLEEVRRHYHHATIFSLPTKLEPFGFVFIEAMAQRLPIVATRLGAIPDFVTDGQNGYLAEPGDVDALAYLLEILIDDPEKCRMLGEAGRRKVETQYSWDNVGKIMKEHITTAVPELHNNRVEISSAVHVNRFSGNYSVLNPNPSV